MKRLEYAFKKNLKRQILDIHKKTSKASSISDNCTYIHWKQKRVFSATTGLNELKSDSNVFKDTPETELLKFERRMYSTTIY